VYFRGLHEAIVSSKEKDHFEQMLELPELEDEKEWLTPPEA